MREGFRNLMKSVNRVEFVFEEIQKMLGENGKIGWLFYILDDGSAYTQKQLSKEWMIPRSTLNDIVKKAQAEGLVMLRPVPNKRRELEILLTEKGKQAATELLEPFYQLEDQALEETIQTYSEEFIQVFEYFSKRLEEGIVQEAKKK